MKMTDIVKGHQILERSRDKTMAIVRFVVYLPAINWVMIGFFIAFFYYFIVSTYLNDYHEFRLFPDFPVLKPLGADLHEYLKFSRKLVKTGTPYVRPNYYPPLQAVFFLRFMLSGPGQSFIYITTLSFLCFLGTTWLFPLLAEKKHSLNTMAVFGVVTGLFSYGLWFQLERGQYDLLVMALCYTGIYLYHFHPSWRWAGYLFFLVSVNIKLYPLIFILCFTTDWRAWWHNLRRWGLLLLANFAGLFVLGWDVFLDFIHALFSQVNRPSYYWTGNHSIDSFCRVLLETLKQSDPAVYRSLQPNIRWIEMGLLLIYLLCLGVVLWISYRRRLSAFNPYLLLLLTIGTMLIPSTSHDYKLSILVAPVVYLFNNLELRKSDRTWLDLAAIFLVFVFSTVYSSTLFMHNDLPFILTNNMPALIILTIVASLLLGVLSLKPGQEIATV